MASTGLSTRRRTAVVGAVCALLALLPFVHASTANPDGSEKLSTVLADLAQAVPQREGPFVADRAAARTPIATDTLPASVRDAVTGRLVRLNARNAVQVYVLVDAVTDDNLAQLKAAGATIEITDPAHRRVQAQVPVERLQAIASLPFVNFVRPPTYAVHRAGAALTEGDAILRAVNARQQFGLDGTGVKVGVLSDGLKGVFATGCTSCGGVAGGPISTGDLPSATGTRAAALLGRQILNSSSGGIIGKSFTSNNDLEGLPSGTCAFAGAGAEGTALLEIVHDIAPNAQLSFANADTDLAFENAVNYLAANNDVVVDDLGFYGDAYDGTSAVSSNTAAALNNGGNRIRAYVTSVGNGADEHYLGTYTDSGTDGTSIGGITTAGHLHQFAQSADTTDILSRGPQPYNLISLPRNGEVAIFLTWDDPFGSSANNYDLYLVRESTNAVVARSTSAQNGKQDPLEIIDYVNTVTTGTTPELFHIVIQNVNGAAQPKQLNLFSFQPECAADGPRLLDPNRHERHNYNTATRSVSAQSDAGGSPVSVISVGAICSGSGAAISATGNRDASCTDPTHSTIEFFSSQGPTIDGRTKPDVSGIDGVAVTGAGSFVNPFFGTSAAAPHVAGIAALLLQASPCLVSGANGAVDPVTARQSLRNLVVGNAVPLGGAPPDNTFGSGRADALNSVQKTLPVLSGPPAVIVAGNSSGGATISAAQLGFSDPNQCTLTKVTATGGCSTATSGGAITCPFGTTTTSVSASNNGVSFSPAANVQVNVTNFSVVGAPSTKTITAGQSTVFQATVTAQGGPFASPVTLGCSNLPAQTTCSFNPPTVTPGTAFAQSTVTISTTARPQSQLRRRVIAASLPPWSAPPAMPWLAVLASLAGLSAVAWKRSAIAGAGRRLVLAQRPASLSWPAAVVVALAFGPVFGQSSCGNSSQPPPAPSVALSPATLTFNAQNLQTTSATQTVTLTNTGKAALTISGIAASGDFAQTNTCGSSVAAGGNCSIAVTFTPTATGQRTGSVSITDNASGSPHAISLSGTGQANGTPAGSYQVGITGTNGTNVQSGAITLVVQ